MRIRCKTLFDITQTNVSSRRGRLDTGSDKIQNRQRNQQSNYETLLQIISMRCQPENISDVEILQEFADHTLWGKHYWQKMLTIWKFDFTVVHTNVFMNDNNRLGKLINDCNKVPMITGLDECVSDVQNLNTYGDLKNIHFEEINDSIYNTCLQ